MKYSVVTFGCRVNQADSLGFEEALCAQGDTPAPPEAADLIIVNTCSVTATADQGARQTIRRLARNNPGARIVVTGCYATRRPNEVAALPNVARVIANDDKPRFLALVERISTFDGSLLTTAERFGGGAGSCGAAIEPGLAGRTAFTLRVQTGCDERCAYCIIPSTRGTPRSSPVEHLIREVERVTDAGFKEIVLTGVHLGSYGRDLSPQSSLHVLLEALATVDLPSGTLFRISSLEPMDCTSEVLAVMSQSPRFAHHLHLPLQHANDQVLASMARPYTLARYRSLVDEVRGQMPDAAIGSDVIVGFPGESDEHFEDLIEYLRDSPLTHVHVFPYSDRPGTAATAMPGKVPGPVVRERGRRVREESAALSGRFLDSQVGREHRALTLEDGTLAVTGNYLKVRIPPGHRRNEWVSLRVTSHHHGELLAG